MKKYLLVGAIVFNIFSAQFAFADIIPSDQKSIPVCTYLGGIANFPKLTFLVEEKMPSGEVKSIKTVKEDDCIAASYKFNTVKLFAVNTDHYLQSSQTSGYEPSEDQYAYAADKEIKTTPKLVALDDKTEYEHYNYLIQGIDNSAKTLKISLTSSETNLMVSDYFPVAIEGLDNEIAASLEDQGTIPFNDIAQDSPYLTALTYLKNKGIVSGYTDGSFKPNSTINRAEFTKILMEAGYSAGTLTREPIPTVYDQVVAPFKDVPLNVKDAWYADYVNMAAATSLVQGYSDGTFRPSQNINYAEAAKIIVKAFTISIAPQGDEPWYQAYDDALKALKVVPSTVTSFDHQMTRGEMAQIAYNITIGL